MFSVVSALSNSPSVATEQNDLKLFSCTNCRQRKVRCNRSDPCSRCMKSGVPCTFVPPAPSRRPRRKPVREGLHARLRRYEQILQSYGAKIDASDMRDQSEESPAGEMEPILDHSLNASKLESPATNQLQQQKLVAQRGSTRYFERYVKVHLSVAMRIC